MILVPRSAFRVPRSAFRVLCASVVLVGCVDEQRGSSTSPPALMQPAPDPAPVSLVVFGNSLTRVGPMSGIGWDTDRGMASSSIEADFAHRVAAALGLPVEATNFSELERNPGSAAAGIASMAASVGDNTVVVIELGDNVADGDVDAFGDAYGQLLQAVSHSSRRVCVGTWWYRPATDAVVRAACEAAGGQYVYIGDIRDLPENEDRAAGPQYDNLFVQDHPHDWSMAVIADRVIAVLADEP